MGKIDYQKQPHVLVRYTNKSKGFGADRPWHGPCKYSQPSTTTERKTDMEARYEGKCICGGFVCQGDEIRFANKKIVKCAGCFDFGPVTLGEDRGLGWIWAYRLGRNVETLRALYRAIRTAYLALNPSEHGWADRTERRHGEVLDSVHGTTGRVVETSTEFDSKIKESMAREIKDWAGQESFDRLTVGQLHCLHAATLYVSAATSKTWIEASPETLEWGGFLGGEMVHSDSDATKALNEMIGNVFRKAA